VKEQDFGRSFELISSPDNHFLGILVPPPPSGGKLNFYLLRDDGTLLTHLELPMGSDQLLPRFYLSDSGHFASLQVESSYLRFYNPSGQEIRSRVLFGEHQWMERNAAGAFSQDGRFFAIALMAEPAVPDRAGRRGKSGYPHLLLFDQRGRELWRRPLEGYWSGQVAISPHGRFIVASSYQFSETEGVSQKVSVVLDSSGQEVARLSFLFRHASFSEDDHQMILANRWELIGLDLPSGQIRWRYRIEGQKGLIVGLQTSPKAQRTAVLLASGLFSGGKFLFQNPLLLILDRNGHLLQRLPLDSPPFRKPLFRFSRSGKSLGVALGNVCQKIAEVQ